MPSFMLPELSGGSPLFSGNPYSGQPLPNAEILIKLSENASGNIFVGMALGLTSAGITVNSGGFLLSGNTLVDGYQVSPGGEIRITRGQCSGNLDKIRIAQDAATSGRARVYWDIR